MSEAFDSRLRQVEREAAAATLQISNHEEVCAERYQAISARHGEMKAAMSASHGEMKTAIGGIRSLLLKVGLMLLTGMAAVIGFLIKQSVFGMHP